MRWCCRHMHCCWDRSQCGLSLGRSANTAVGAPGSPPQCMYPVLGRAYTLLTLDGRSSLMRGRLCTGCRLGLAPDPSRTVAHGSAGSLPAPVAHHSTLGTGGAEGSKAERGMGKGTREGAGKGGRRGGSSLGLFVLFIKDGWNAG